MLAVNRIKRLVHKDAEDAEVISNKRELFSVVCIEWQELQTAKQAENQSA
jgi:hypothetical protein